MNNVFVSMQTWAKTMPIICHRFSEIGSTNDEAKSFSYNDEKLHLFLAATQTAGRGRGKNTWLNPEMGEALLSTWALHLTKNPQPITTPLIGLALYQASLSTFPDLPWSMKAPNDIYLGEHKVGGILVENLDYRTHHRLLIGIGMNFLGKPKNLPLATSLQEHLNSPLQEKDFSRFLDIFYKNLQKISLRFSDKLLISEEQEALLQALKKHKNFQKLLLVQKDGSLEFADRTISWIDL